ncbi:MAG TPA: heavy metal-binding domain-containing protein [Flavobacterium sp.]|jgi:hypothetical protein
MKTKVFTLLAISIIFVACNDKKAETVTATTDSIPAQKTSPAANEVTAKLFSCPMHPEVTGNKGDICPKCEMKLTEPVASGNTAE